MTVPRYFHGGTAGLRVGDVLLPPSATGALPVLDFAPEYQKEEVQRVGRPDRVFLTTNQLTASAYAALHPDGSRNRGGDVYEAEPQGAVEHDQDWLGPPGVSVQVPSARIVRVVERGVLRSIGLRLVEAW